MLFCIDIWAHYTYESGQHFVTTGIGGVGGNLTGEQVAAVNTHPRMYQWYQIYAGAWHNQSITSTNVFYTSSAPCTSELQSCFGMVTSCDQPLEEAHKLRGLLDWANNTIIVGLEENGFLNESSIIIYPNPTSGHINIQTDVDFQQIEVAVFNLLGEKIMSLKNQKVIDINSTPSGTYLLIIETDDFKEAHKIIKLE